VKYELIDNDDGSYFINFKQEEDCVVNIDIRYENEEGVLVPIRGNPFTGSFSSKADPKNNKLVGPNVSQYITNSLKEIQEFITETSENIDIRKKNINENVQ
jgi:hypothetical protein